MKRVGYFALQQALIFGLGAGALYAIRRLTGRNLHELADAPTLPELGGYVAVCGSVVALSAWLLRRADPNGPGLGLALDRARLRDVALGFALGFAWNALPWLWVLVGQGGRVTDALWLGDLGPWLPACIGIGIGLANAAFEEITSRAFPMQLWRDQRAWFRLALPAACFALQHLTAGALDPLRLLNLFALGIVFGWAFLVRGSPWLGIGLHAGYFQAALAPSGRFDSGAWMSLDRGPSYAVFDAATLVLATLLFAHGVRRRAD
ncbi:MAG: CPBP family intramembrane metalloprotease [Planctomycetota bacterium]|nr:MAG: CPBP family intramembrane metalloprotease [Planctomycetota bacterium]